MGMSQSMDGNEVIVLRNVTKSFKIYQDKGQTLRDRVITRGRSRHSYFQVLKDISLTINSGEVVGLIGENGCGKSTALKIISRIIYPDTGTVAVCGRVSSLLELGAGFHPELSGRENIYTNAAIFGLSKKETDERLSSIIDFSELWDFIDNPVRTYSSGMYMRLAFSVAINVDADVLLIDEILAVGDKNFQEKCYGRLRELKEQGITIILVTHDTTTVEDFCSRAVWLNDGHVAADGPTSVVVNAYLEHMFEKQLLIDKRQQEEQKKAELARKDYSRADITELYLKYLNRPPESEDVIDFYFGLFDRKRDIELSIRNSAEHRSLVLQQRQGQAASQEQMQARLSREDVVETYRAHLQREPESEQVIEANQHAFATREELAASLVNSPEYRLLSERHERGSHRKAAARTPAFGEPAVTAAPSQGPAAVEITGLSIHGDEAGGIFYGMPAEIRVGYRMNSACEGCRCIIEIYTTDGALCCRFETGPDMIPTVDWKKTPAGELVCSFPALPLFPGKYKLYAAMLDRQGLAISNWRLDTDVVVTSSGSAMTNAPHEWILE